ncbi:NAD(P)-binding protein [Artomyces pyxidatus]|uniref:NAD(P)-binding protein n=1 Tax=Artomyces pyxidatus TaxID=48021 RepID=A0ACB8TBV0_9AGAM|nr:NAD(P)-binding protein [Artomyces pyxidatus]
MASWNAKTTAQEAASVLQNEIKGKNVLITGVSPHSLGAETVRALAPYAKTIIIASRTRSKVDEVIAEVKTDAPSASFIFVALDLASLASVKTAAAEVNALGLPIHVLINNAAVPHYPALTRTADGFEAQMGANHLGHFLFDSLVMPSIKLAAKDGSARIVVVSSLSILWGGELRFDDMFYEKRPEEYKNTTAYAQSKTANILFARSLAKKAAKDNILVFSLNPGVIMETGAGTGVATRLAGLKAYGLIDDEGNPTLPNRFRTIEQGTSTQVIASFDPSLKDKSGAFLLDGVLADGHLPAFAKDEALGEQLWELSEQLVGHKFDI